MREMYGLGCYHLRPYRAPMYKLWRPRGEMGSKSAYGPWWANRSRTRLNRVATSQSAFEAFAAYEAMRFQIGVGCASRIRTIWAFSYWGRRAAINRIWVKKPRGTYLERMGVLHCNLNTLCLVYDWGRKALKLE